jgi:hypothetical protein
MPNKCCVPNCSSNYARTILGTSSAYVTMFYFPKDDETKQKWLKSIRRESFIPTKHSSICVKHFPESCIVRMDRMTRADGSTLELPRKRLKLTKNAVPSIFPNPPLYMTQKSSVKRKNPVERRQVLINQDESDETKFKESSIRHDEILNFDNFLLKFKERNLFDFLFKISENCVSFFKVDCDSDVCPTVVAGFKIFRDFKVAIFYNNVIISAAKFSWILGSDLSCSNWSQFDCLLSHINSNDINEIVEKIEGVLDLGEIQVKDEIEIEEIQVKEEIVIEEIQVKEEIQY